MDIEPHPLAPSTRRGLIQAANLIVIMVIASLATLRFVIMDGGYIPAPGLLVVGGCLVIAIYLKQNGSADIAARALIGLLLFGLFYGAYNTGGFQGPIVLLAPVIPIFTLLLFSPRSAWWSAGLVCLILACLYALDVYKLIPENPNGPARIMFGRFITLIALCFISTWAVWSFARVSRRLLAKIEHQSNTDYLTGILNRRAFELTLAREISRARRTNAWLSFIITDVDWFKEFNDANGHQAGDLCLINVAKVIGACCGRTTDVLGRFGGEEFVVILPETDARGACKVAESIRLEMLQQNIPYGTDNTNPVTLTLGLVSARGGMIDSMEQLIRQADDALYRGKHQGRNCVVSVVLDNAEQSPDTPRRTPPVSTQLQSS